MALRNSLFEPAGDVSTYQRGFKFSRPFLLWINSYSTFFCFVLSGVSAWVEGSLGGLVSGFV